MSRESASIEHDIEGPTPEFVRWALEQPCSLRTNARWQDAEQTERQLRSLRAYCQAVKDGRLFEGICVERGFDAVDGAASKVKGFRASEILESYGGLALVEHTCGVCPANLPSTTGGIGGCHGWFEIETLGENFHQAVEEAVEQFHLASSLSAAFAPTRPRWHGLWIDSPLTALQTQALCNLFHGLLEICPEFSDCLSPVYRALSVSKEQNLPFHQSFMPRGVASDNRWSIVAHCPRCKAEVSTSQRRCRTCGRTGIPTAPRIRNSRGSRPFWSLERFLGKMEANAFLNRYSTRVELRSASNQVQ